ncbi:MAG: hypothetical protein ACYTBJ_10610 [Planctomycetota bacterium]|jgi:hypothetical protein
MARFYQPPRLQARKYGFELPFKEIMMTLQGKQKVQDENLNQLETILEKTPKNLFKDLDIRRSYMHEKEKRIDNIILDDEGNLQDLTGAGAAIRREARKQAKAESTGGTYWALENSYDLWDKHKTAVLANKNIGKERKNWIIKNSMKNYAGIGDKTEYSESDLFSGIVAADEVDEIEIADKYLQGWATTKIQVSGGGPGGSTKVSPTKEYLDELIKTYPEFRGVLGGDYIQTGELEYILIDDLYAGGQKALWNNQQVIDDLSQEAEQRGARNPTEIQAYVANKISEASLTVAEKYSKSHFSPKIMENWRKKKAADFAYKKSYKDWEDAQNLNILQVQSNTTQRSKSFDQIVKDRDSAVKALNASKAKLQADFMDENGNLRDEIRNNPIRYNEYRDAQASVNKARSVMNKAHRTILNQVDANNINVRGQLHTELKGVLDRMAGTSGIKPTDPAYQELANLYEQGIAPILNNTSNVELARITYDEKNYSPELVSAIKQIATTLYDKGVKSMGMGSKEEEILDNIQMINAHIFGVSLNIDQEVEDRIKNNQGGKIHYSSNYTGMFSYSGSGTTDKGIFGAWADKITSLVTKGHGVWADPNTGSPFNPLQTLKSMGGSEGITAPVAIPTKQRDPDTGETIYLLSATDKATNKAIQIAFTPQAGSDNSFDQDQLEISYKMIKSAYSKESQPTFRHDFETATEMMGQTQYSRDIASSGIENAPNGSEVLLNNATFLVKTPQGHYALYPSIENKSGHKVPDYKKPFKDSRTFGRDISPGKRTNVFRTLREIYQLLGEADYARLKNQYKGR